MKLWVRYVKERKAVVLLWFVTVSLFVGVGALYHVENLGKLLYAALLTLVVWGAAGFLRGMKYVDRSRKLEEAYRHFEQSGELLLEGWNLKPDEKMEQAESFAEAQMVFLSRVYEEMDKNSRKWERRSGEYKDYYLMWTHQIKTPISALKLLVEGSGVPGRDGFLMREELFKIEQYVEMVLTFQRLESMASDLVLQEYDLYSLLKQAVKKYSVLFINNGLSLDLQEMQVKILTDEKWFVFCLEQILSNSIKYTQKGGIHIYVKLDSWEGEDGDYASTLVHAKEGVAEAITGRNAGQRSKSAAGAGMDALKGSCRVRLYIQDTGIGICPEDLPRIFEKGFTGYNGRMEKKSTGIGLYLCRQIFSHLGIRIKVESREGEGTRVILIWDQREPSLQAD